MSLKGNMLYLCLPLFCYILYRMVHPVFLLFVLILLAVYKKYLSLKQCAGFLIVFVSLCFLFSVPSPTGKTYIKGEIVSVDDNSIVVSTGYYKYKVYGEFEDVRIYDDIELYGHKYEINSFYNDHAFDYQRYLYSINVFDVLTLDRVVSYHQNDHLYHMIEKRVNQNDSVKNLVSLFVLGVKDETIEDYYERLTDLSLVHLFALSGMHLSLLKKWLCQFLRFFFSKKMQDAVSFLIITLYVSIIPYNVSFLRSYFMLILPVIFKRFFNRMDIFSMLSIIMLYYNPYLLFNLSFIFSYVIYFMILLFSNHKSMNTLLLLSSIPIIISVNYKINILSIALSGVLTPVIEWMYQLMLYYLVLGDFAVPVLKVVIDAFNMMMNFIYDVSFYLYFSKPGFLFIAFYYYFYLKIIFKVNMNRRYTRELCCLVSLMIAFYFYPFYNIKGKVVMISVGQGDCFLISQPFSKGDVLIDTGGLTYMDVAEDIVVPYLYSQGISSLDAVFISHQDDDHCGALPSLQNLFDVKEVIYDFEEKKIGDLVFYKLALNKDYEDENDNSSIIYVDVNGLKYLFMGDASDIVEKDLLETYQSLDVDVLKIGHHGSSTSTSGELLKLTKPRIALISVGKYNFYGHPSDEVLQRLDDYGIEVYRSDEDGMVEIYYYGDDHYIETYHKE